jgi:hypothetical protein
VCQNDATHDFEVLGVRATVTVAGREIEGYLTARGSYKRKSSHGESPTGADPGLGRESIVAIDGLFGMREDEKDLSDPPEPCILRFPLSDGIASIWVSVRRSGMTCVWLVEAVEEASPRVMARGLQPPARA